MGGDTPVMAVCEVGMARTPQLIVNACQRFEVGHDDGQFLTEELPGIAF